MMDEMANHKTRILRHIDKQGQEAVENFIDACLSLDTLIDYHASAIKRRKAKAEPDEKVVRRMRTSRPYMENYVNPEDFIKDQERWLEDERKKEKNFPENPERDVLLFLLEKAPMEIWERDILSIIREETYYFAPQGQTKIMNEGWAVFWHSKIMTEKALKDSELIDYADHHSGTVAMMPGGLNPYKIGFELFKDIEDRWNKGKFGKEYEECDNMVERKNWDRKMGLGREKIFEVRKIYNDVTFIDTFLTPEFCQEHKLFVYAYDLNSGEMKIATKAFETIKKKLLFQLTNFGHPIINVIDANYKNRAELLLNHVYEGVDLRMDYANETLKNLYKIWKRPANIKTIVAGVPKVLGFDGQNYTEERL